VNNDTLVHMALENTFTIVHDYEMGCMMKHNTKTRITIGGVTYITVVEYASVHGTDVKQLRRNCRLGNVSDAIQPIGRTWVVPVDMDVPTFASRGPRSKHDGKRMIAYIPDAVKTEHDAWCTSHGITVVDPAVLRAERKLRKQTESDVAS